MADQTGELRRIDWAEQFPFTRIFRSFRMAIQPSKLALALAAVVLMGIWGYVLDGLWRWSDSRPVGPEVWAFWQTPDVDRWREAQAEDRLDLLNDVYSSGGLLAAESPEDRDVLRRSGALKEAQRKLRQRYRSEVAELAERPAEEREDAIAALAARYYAEHDRLSAYQTRGIFSSWLDYETDVVDRFLQSARAVLALDWYAVAGGTDEVVNARLMAGELRYPGDFSGIGMLGSLLLIVRGVQWMLVEHPFFAILFLLGTLAIWSIFGGAIVRMSALDAARDEQISIKTALGFATRKFMAFFSAPLLPVVLVVMIGFLIWLGSLVFMAIPYVGDILGPILLVLALVGGFVMTLVVVGAAGGGPLLWPTIGVEGSDGFDAISRSYSYFYSRPWRTAFYVIVAAIYGAVTYFVLRYFVYIVLRLTRYVVSLGTWMTERPATGQPDATKVEAMWPMPTPENLLGEWSPMLGLARGSESVGSYIIFFWVMLVVLLLCAYLASFFFSSSTVIYLLLRRRVDATDFEDVYQEEEQEPAPATTESGASAGTEASAETSPAAEPSTGGDEGQSKPDEPTA